MLDTNVRRVLARVFLGRPPRRAAADGRRLADLNLALIPAGKAWDFNQAVMEFGAVICTARKPRCGACMVRDLCRYYPHLPQQGDGVSGRARGLPRGRGNRGKGA